MTLIQWYPGHMHKAMKEMVHTLKKVNLVIEILDARLPYSSQNPSLNQLCNHRPRIRLLSHNDIADHTLTTKWIQYFSQHDNIDSVAINTKSKGLAQLIISRCKKIFVERDFLQKPILVMVTGIPNVGKSSFINSIVGRNVAKTGDEVAITRQQQRVSIGNGIDLLDTPGVLWPNLDHQQGGLRLAATGAVRDAVLSPTQVASFILDSLRDLYPKQLLARYESLSLSMHGNQLLEKVAYLRCFDRAG